MSIATKCNYCIYRQYKEEAAANGNVVTVRRAAQGGINLFVHPANEGLNITGDAEKHPYFRAWMMALGDHCIC